MRSKSNLRLIVQILRVKAALGLALEVDPREDRLGDIVVWAKKDAPTLRSNFEPDLPTSIDV